MRSPATDPPAARWRAIALGLAAALAVLALHHRRRARAAALRSAEEAHLLRRLRRARAQLFRVRLELERAPVDGPGVALALSAVEAALAELPDIY